MNKWELLSKMLFSNPAKGTAKAIAISAGLVIANSMAAEFKVMRKDVGALSTNMAVVANQVMSQSKRIDKVEEKTEKNVDRILEIKRYIQPTIKE